MHTALASLPSHTQKAIMADAPTTQPVVEQAKDAVAGLADKLAGVVGVGGGKTYGNDEGPQGA